MSINVDNIEVRNNAAENRYEVTIDGQLSMIEYQLHNNRITFTHTGVPPALGGQGIASKIAKFALEDSRAKGYQVRPLCPFVVKYIERHPEYQSLVQ